MEATVTIVRSEPVPGPDGKIGQLSHVIASGMGLKSLVARPVPAPAEQTIAAAVEAARAAEVAVVVVGLTEEQETEALDKHTLALPGEQDALVSAVAAAARRTVVVVNAATPVLMPWADQVDAILVAGLPGQEGGHAVADALLGVREPAGRLVTSYPAADGENPAWEVVPTDLRLEYTDGTFVGYRGFAAGRATAPAWWFGHGLGYATWDYPSARLADAGGAAPRVEVTVRNADLRDSREVVQVYLQPAEQDQPVRLVGWAAVEVPAGQSATVAVDCDDRLWRRWDAAAGRWARLADGGELHRGPRPRRRAPPSAALSGETPRSRAANKGTGKPTVSTRHTVTTMTTASAPRAPRRRPGRPRGGDGGDTREQVLSAAAALFAEQGYRATSMVAVAEQAGLSQTGLLHHFPSKELLLAGVLQRRDEQDMAAMGAEQDARGLGRARPSWCRWSSTTPPASRSCDSSRRWPARPSMRSTPGTSGCAATTGRRRDDRAWSAAGAGGRHLRPRGTGGAHRPRDARRDGRPADPVAHGPGGGRHGRRLRGVRGHGPRALGHRSRVDDGPREVYSVRPVP